MSSLNEVILEIEGASLKCSRKELSEHSDYFKIMFEADFLERDKHKIKLEGVCLRALQIIINSIRTGEHLKDQLANTKDLLSVLQTACMLQFGIVQGICIDILNERLVPNNCIEIWLACETLNLRPLYLKARNMALVEFEIAKSCSFWINLNLNQLCRYLADRNLRCENELSVFHAGMLWWNTHNEMADDKNEILLTVLTCLDFNSLSDLDLDEIQTNQSIAESQEITVVVSCIKDTRRAQNLNGYNNDTLAKAMCLLKSRCRLQENLCLLLHFKDESRMTKTTDTDKMELLQESCFVTVEGGIASSDIGVRCFKKITNLDIPEFSKNISGHKAIGYKQFIFLFGGEFLIGKGTWNTNFWAYDTIHKKWNLKCKMPFVRRHFQLCLCKNHLYVIGGTGEFRVIQEDMFWYDLEKGEWSKRIFLPCSGRQIKCCQYNSQLFLLSINDRCGYMYDQSKSKWLKINISRDALPNLHDKFTVISYKNHIFIKGSSLVQFELVDQELHAIKKEPLDYKLACYQLESVLCGNILYTLYEAAEDSISDDCDVYLTLEQFYMDTHATKYHLVQLNEHSGIDSCLKNYSLKTSSIQCSFPFYVIIQTEDYVNDYFLRPEEQLT